MKITPNQVRFFFNATITKPGEEPQPPLLEKLLRCQLPPDFRYRIIALRRQLESAMKPVEAKMKDLYDAYQESTKPPTGNDDADTTDANADHNGDDSHNDNPEDEEATKAKADALAKLNADIEAIMSKEIEFDGKLILASQLEDLDGADVRSLLNVPAVMEEWLFPFIIEDDQTQGSKPIVKK